MATFYKVLTDGGTGGHTGFVWPRPARKRPGRWVKVTGPLGMCSNGLHVCTVDQLMSWLDVGPHIYRVETRGDHLDETDKSCWREARLIAKTPWDDRTARLFAADCAEHVLHIFEEKRPGDDRPRTAIQAARDFADGRIDAKARAAAWAAARDAARAAARDAARAAARDAARDAAAWAAARAAAWAAAWDAEYQWQAQRLAHYLGIEA